MRRLAMLIYASSAVNKQQYNVEACAKAKQDPGSNPGTSTKFQVELIGRGVYIFRKCRVYSPGVIWVSTGSVQRVWSYRDLSAVTAKKTIIANLNSNGNVTFVNFGEKLPTNEEFALAA